MPRLRMCIARTLMVAALIGCAGNQSPSTETPAAGSFDPCPSPPASREGDAWRGVVADGFTFCVPAHWRPAGSRAWRGDGMSVEWSVARPAQQRLPFAVATTGADRPETRTLVETIGGERVEINTIRSALDFRAFATWKEPRIVFEGAARGPTDEAVLLDIYRSVRRAARIELSQR